MVERSPTIGISERVVVVIVLVALGAYMLWAFFDAWGPSLRKLT